MLVKDQEKKKEIKRALNAFLAVNGKTLSEVAKELKIDPNAAWQKLNRGTLDVEFVNKVIKQVNKEYSLQQFGKTFMVSRR